MASQTDIEDRLAGLLLGTAAGDAIGLPREGLTPTRAVKLFGGAPLGHRLVFGKGVVSDDTEHAFLAGRALLCASDSPERYGRELAKGLRRWFCALPPGVGLATARACVKMLLHFSPDRSGAVSAGNWTGNARAHNRGSASRPARASSRDGARQHAPDAH